ncbi:UDP-N-acetylenolpyruvoylglucosamine reductase [Prosthecochloris sp. CIB 2401]|nr:UDP-N-acetylenolpyruvoylglucosamine reductase [Prosthecochloris sp. CIB 2401]
MSEGGGLAMLNMQELLSLVKGRVAIGEEMREHTSFRIGGPADFFIEPMDRQDFIRAVGFFTSRRIPFVILGRGSNILVHDEGIRGGVIMTGTALQQFSIKKQQVEADAGVSVSLLAEKTFSSSLGGIELLQGIPGTVGGAVRMNAGAWGQEIFQVLSWVEVLRGGRTSVLYPDELEYGYRQGGFGSEIVLRAGFRLKRLSEREHAERSRRVQEIRLQRARTQPLSFPNAGSVFKNPERSIGGESLSAGALIDRCGLKGYSCGGALVSELHGNFIVNTGSASAADVMKLVEVIRNRVAERFGVVLELEIGLLGFDGVICR